MKCPGCGAEVASGTSICPSCDYIIDDGFLGAAPPPSSEKGDTNPGFQMPAHPPARPGKKRRPAARPAKRANGAARNEPPPAPTPMMAPVPPSRASEGAPSGGGPASYSPVFRPDEAMDDARLFLGGLGTGDKLALTGGGLMALCSFLPWKDTAADGEVIGLQSSGVVATLLMVTAIGVLIARARKSLRLGPALAWLIQLGSAGAAVAWCLVYIKVSTDLTPAHSVDGNMMVAASKPALGAYIGVVAGLIGAAGSLLGMKEGGA